MNSIVYMTDEEIAKKLESGPLVLLIGQKYLSLESGKDILLQKLIEKYRIVQPENRINYDIFFNANETADYDLVSSWMNELSKSVSVPAWLERIARLPWSNVYTTAIDPIIQRAFWTEWRKVQPIYDEKYKIIDPRNKFILHLSYLFGSITQTEPSKKPPVNSFDKIRRKVTNINFLQRLPEIVTPKGIVIIEAYDEDDWLTIEDLYGVLSRFSKNQIFFFSSSIALKNNPFIQNLSNAKKVTVFDQSFADFIADLESTKKLRISIPEADEYFGKWISINDKKVKLPQDIINQVSKTATIIEDNLFEVDSDRDADDRYFKFKSFLASTNTSPNWQGYTAGFAFTREYYSLLRKKVEDKIASNKNRDTPLIVYGQSSSGKTISLGLLAYELSWELKMPVLFIEKRYQKIDHIAIDVFCKWAEDNNASSTVIIWDGMFDQETYNNFLNKLNARGRNVVLVASCYTSASLQKDKQNNIECPIDLTSDEKKRFVQFIKGIDPLLSNIMSGIDDTNFLAMLYWHLPSSRPKIKSGLKEEFNFFSKLIRDSQAAVAEPRGNIFKLLIDAGVFSDTPENEFEEAITVDGDQTNLADRIIFLIMVPGQYALNVPFELILRTIGYESMSSNIFKAISDVNLITWYEDSQGNIMLGPRTAIEAKILTRYLGSQKAQVDYIVSLLSEVRSFDFVAFESTPEVQFLVELLNNIGPNATEAYNEYLYDITEVLRNLRESGQAYHPRLILKEASFLRELTKKANIVLTEPKLDLLLRAENMVVKILDELSEYQERTITNYLRVELASILGTKAVTLIQEKHPKSEIIGAYESVKDINSYAFAINPDNYNALDVMAWTTEQLIKKNIFSEEEKINAEVEMLSAFELAETEGVNFQNMDDFQKRKLTFYELLGKQDMADKIFDQLARQGSASGYYIRARKMIAVAEMLTNAEMNEVIVANKKAFDYLDASYEKISNDGRCLYLLLKAWWITKAKTPLFSGEKQSLPFTKADWSYCYEIIELLLTDSSVYQSATIFYIKAIAEFHLNLIKQSFETFRLLGDETDFSSYGRRRVIKTYLASEESGNARVFGGEVKRNVSQLIGNKTGEIYVADIKESIPFNLVEFGRTSFQRGEIIDRFFIGFNFRGPIAVPFKN